MEALKNKLIQFAKDRNWEAHHSPKNLAMALSCEAAELLELFTWITEEQSHRIMEDPEQKKAVEHELADVFNVLLYLAAALNVDLIQAANEKILLNAKKYPIPKN